MTEQLTFPDPGENIGGGARATDPQTSVDASKLNGVRNGTTRVEIGWEFYHSPSGLTAEEALHNTGRTRGWQRVSDLKVWGFLETTGETRPGVTGAQMEVLRMTDEGRAAWRNRFSA